MLTLHNAIVNHQLRENILAPSPNNDEKTRQIDMVQVEIFEIPLLSTVRTSGCADRS